eukprot:TRINITY_DN112549_c0_g1_i1.p1 TRINITY_DN112549_c0_g1~~TRINITY_DN112549_c0_g1_i1.p1  ORF type:complete len:304 (-),score=26.34 TRINITY_DN112549_c0_g1_i1:16-927(-)
MDVLGTRSCRSRPFSPILCAVLEILHNPSWRVILLDRASCCQYVETADLPEFFVELPINVAADALRLALLHRHGGVYVDVGVICQEALDDWLMPDLSTKHVAAFYYEAFGKEECRNSVGDYVENWFLASHRQHPLILAWQRAFLRFWQGRRSVHEGGGLAKSNMFRSTNLNCMHDYQKDYLTMHCCFKWAIDHDATARRLWLEDMLLLRADDAALGWILDLAGTYTMGESWLAQRVAARHCARWLYRDDLAWVDGLLQRAPLLKFIGCHAATLDRQSVSNLLRPGSCANHLLTRCLVTQKSDT